MTRQTGFEDVIEDRAGDYKGGQYEEITNALDDDR